jgi:hypothetical protein
LLLLQHFPLVISACLLALFSFTCCLILCVEQSGCGSVFDQVLQETLGVFASWEWPWL